MNNQIYGTFWGNLTGTVYFLLFQAAGLFLIRFIFHKKENRFYLLAGSVLGSVLFHWLPAVCSLFSGFTMTAHLLALFLLCLIFAVLLFTHRPFEASRFPSGKELLLRIRSHGGFVLLYLPLRFFCLSSCCTRTRCFPWRTDCIPANAPTET